MNIFDRKQTQFELFPGSNPDSDTNTSKKALVLKDLTLSQENIIVLVIVSVMVCILFYSFGVDRGKKSGLQEQKNIELVSRSVKEQDPQVVFDDLTADANVVEEELIAENMYQPKSTDADVREIIEIPIDLDLPQEFQYTIQVASFQLEKNARKEASLLEKKGHSSLVLPKGKYSIVCVGKFGGKKEAKAYSSRLKSRYSDFLIRRL